MSKNASKQALEEIISLATRLQGNIDHMTDEHHAMIKDIYDALNQIDDEILL